MFKLLRGETEKIIELNEYGIILRRKRDGDVNVYVRYDGYDEYISDSIDIKLRKPFTDLCERAEYLLKACVVSYSHPNNVVEWTLHFIQSYNQSIF